jgi:palmitoyl-protein thioesterase
MWGPLNHLVIFLASSNIIVGDRPYGYRPVILMHGLLVSSDAMDSLEQRILTAHPGTPVFNIDAYNDADSLKPMWQQVHGVYRVIGPILDSSPDGAILIGHSQGGVIFRGILEAYPTSNITFISLASPMAGQFGTAQISEIIPLITKEFMYHYCYLSEARHSVSICNWWKDPTQMTLYRTNNNFLYPLESPTDKEYKSNFERIGKLVLIGGPDDGIVEPWQSTQFGYYDKNMKIEECVDQE